MATKKSKSIMQLVFIGLVSLIVMSSFSQLSQIIYASDHSATIKYLSKSEAEKMVTDARNTILVDVRNNAEYLQFHIDHAVNIPMRELNEHLKELEPYKEKNIIIYCQQGNRSKQVAKQLSVLGYKRLYVIASGLN